MKTLNLKVILANDENTKEFGFFLAPNKITKELPIPYHPNVLQGGNLPFHCDGEVVIRNVCIKQWNNQVDWLERHLAVTQAFIGLGNQPFALVLSKPNHICGSEKPELKGLKCLLFPPGHGIIMHIGTWHDFPLAYNREVTCLILNSKQIIDTLIITQNPQPLNKGDICKISVRDQLAVNINLHKGHVEWEGKHLNKVNL